MPPKRTLFADPDRILTSIHDAVSSWIEDIEAEREDTAVHLQGVLERELDRARDGWVPYDLSMFSGRNDLSESEKQVWRREVRALETGGFVERYCKAIRLTDAGNRRVDALAKRQERAASRTINVPDVEGSEE